jgi:lipoprotein-anchoring transpeptidase ErfK/SrfK
MRRRASLIAALTAFVVSAAGHAALADGPAIPPPILPGTIEADTAAIDEAALVRSKPPQRLPFEDPGIAFAGMGRAARAAATPAPEGSGAGRRIVYAVGNQRVWLIEADGAVFDTYLVSGRRGTPRPGSYRVYSKSPRARATHDGITMRYMVRFTRASTGVAIGFHDLPRYADGRLIQTDEELGTYQSGGCIRQPHAAAMALYDWAPVGTTVVVLS